MGGKDERKENKKGCLKYFHYILFSLNQMREVEFLPNFFLSPFPHSVFGQNALLSPYSHRCPWFH